MRLAGRIESGASRTMMILPAGCCSRSAATVLRTSFHKIAYRQLRASLVIRLFTLPCEALLLVCVLLLAHAAHLIHTQDEHDSVDKKMYQNRHAG